MSDSRRGIRAAQAGILINAALAGTKLVAGIVGNTYALVADAVESMADIFGSLIVWGGLHVASLPADEEHPFGHGKAEALAAMCVSLMLLAAAAFVGISIALLGSRYAGGTGWASADDWAALVASAVIAYNGVSTVHAAMHGLMDRMPGQAIVAPIRRGARRRRRQCDREAPCTEGGNGLPRHDPRAGRRRHVPPRRPRPRRPGEARHLRVVAPGELRPRPHGTVGRS